MKNCEYCRSSFPASSSGLCGNCGAPRSEESAQNITDNLYQIIESTGPENGVGKGVICFMIVAAIALTAMVFWPKEESPEDYELGVVERYYTTTILPCSTCTISIERLVCMKSDMSVGTCATISEGGICQCE